MDQHETDLRQLTARYRGVTAPPGFSTRVMRSIDRQPARRPIWQTTLALAAALVVAVIVGLQFIDRPGAPTEPGRVVGPAPAPLAQQAPEPDLPHVAPPADMGVAQAPDEPIEQVADGAVIQTQLLAAASDWLARAEAAPAPDLSDVPDAMALQSLAELPDPFS